MSDHCSTWRSSGAAPKSHRCPVNGKEYKAVSLKTILHHIRGPWAWDELQQAYYFCADSDCAVVYFGENDSVITTSALRTTVGIKERSKDALVCYCFGVSYGQAAEKPEIRQFVLEQTKNNVCACDIRNPSGECCLKGFPKQ